MRAVRRDLAAQRMTAKNRWNRGEVDRLNREIFIIDRERRALAAERGHIVNRGSARRLIAAKKLGQNAAKNPDVHGEPD